LDIFVQLILIGKFLDNSVVSPYAPTAMDAADYANRAEMWQTQGFNQAFYDASRVPGYPFLILLADLVYPSSSYLVVRIFQMLAVATSVGLLKIVVQKYVSVESALMASVLYIFLPIWHFVPIIIGEATTSVVVIVIIYLLAKRHNEGLSFSFLLYISMAVAVATYIKPNNILILIPIFGFLIFIKNSRVLISVTGILLFVLILLLPWIIYASKVQPGFLGLTTGSGINMYVGTGMILDYDQSVLAKSAIKWKVDPRSNPSDVISINVNQTRVEANKRYTERTIQIWEKRTKNQIGYGLDKVEIAFGLKTNSRMDMTLGIFNLLGLVTGASLLKSRVLRPFGVALLFAAATLAAQAMIFQADRRFVVPILFPFATVCIGIALGRLQKRKLRKNRIFD
jgi:hypothetical protein